MFHVATRVAGDGAPGVGNQEVRLALTLGRTIGSRIRHRYQPKTLSNEDWIPFIAEGRTWGEFEVDIEESFENGALFLEGNVRALAPVQLILDLSDSMRGEKRFWLLCSVAVALLNWPMRELGILGFNVQPFQIKELGSWAKASTILARLRAESGRGYTHLEAALKEGVRQRANWRSRMGRVTTLLVTDGKFTAGRDPQVVCTELEPLIVLKLGADQSSREATHRWARAGAGVALEIAHWRDLPEKTAAVFRHRAARLAQRSLAQ